MLLAEEQRALIEKTVKGDRSFPGNEDLFEDFCSEAFEKSYMIFNSSSSIQKIERYISKVVHTSIMSVLKDSGRVRRSGGSYISSEEIKIEDLKPVEVSTTSVSSTVTGPEFIFDFPDPKDSVEDVLITKDCLQRIVDAVCIIHKEVPAQLFFDIFRLRYVKCLKQSDIAKELNLSQSEVSKRLLKLSKLIGNFLDNDSNQV